MPVVLAEPIHAGQRRDAELGDVVADEQIGLDLHDGAGLLGRGDFIGTGQARPVEQGEDGDCALLRVGLGQPEMRKPRELFLGRSGGIDGNAARRGPVLVVLTRAAEIAGALEGQPVGLAVRPVHHPEAGKAEIGRQLGRHRRIGIFEILRRIDHFPGGAADDDIDLHPLLVELVDMEKPHRERRGATPEQRLAGAEFYFLGLVEIDLADDRRRRLRRHIGLPRHCLGGLLQAREIERLRRSQGRAGLGGGGRMRRQGTDGR